ncbi:MAG: HlyD family efflux transporter periplasmic adaptor subunit [Desulfomonile tiedjei]|uniref:HlyD family efflux transporter periplasmic adaptor subunit n=1 Tax=Desulfomonile tiedjei TaxID=2358 RepID=A0A9D6UYH4_9BACT|nr:HlyD family efflux transporter periplasmic adaptor subunit [Desulfomonile tiedjei]
MDWKAPFDGAVTELSPAFQPGAWPGKGSVVGELASRTACEVLALIPESDVSAVPVGETVSVWWPVETGMSHRVTVREVSRFKTEDLEGSPFSSRFGGEIATEIQDKGGKDTPLEPYYLCKMDFPNQTGLPLGMTGRVVVKHQPKSAIKRLVDAIYGVFHREMIF